MDKNEELTTKRTPAKHEILNILGIWYIVVEVNENRIVLEPLDTTKMTNKQTPKSNRI